MFPSVCVGDRVGGKGMGGRGQEGGRGGVGGGKREMGWGVGEEGGVG